MTLQHTRFQEGTGFRSFLPSPFQYNQQLLERAPLTSRDSTLRSFFNVPQPQPAAQHWFYGRL